MKNIKTTFALAILLLTPNIYAQDVFVREIYYEADKKAPTNEVRVKAIEEIKRSLLDELGTFVISRASYHVENHNNEDFLEEFTKTAQSYSQTIMRIKILEEKRRPKVLYIKASVEVDVNELNDNLKQAGLKYKKELFIEVFNLLTKSNVLSVSPLVLQSTDRLLSNQVSMINEKSTIQVLDIKKNTVGKILNGSKLLNGNYKVTFSNNTYARVSIKDGYLNDTMVVYNSKHKVIEKGRYIDNLKEGHWEHYNTMGDVVYLYKTENFSAGLKNGKTVTYTSQYNKNAKEVVLYKNNAAYYKETYNVLGNGDISTLKGGLDSLGNKLGKWKYFENDKLISEINYEHGKKNGKFSTYYKNGQIASEGTYKNNKKTGVYKTFSSNGIKESKIEYDNNGKQTGLHLLYHPNGKLKQKTEFKPKGKVVSIFDSIARRIELCEYAVNPHNPSSYIKNGAYFSWYSNGQQKENATYDNEKIIGKHLVFFEDGSPKLECNYILFNGKRVLDGKYILYNDKKQLKKKGTYKNGEYDGLVQIHGHKNAKKEKFYKGKELLWEKNYNNDGNLIFEHVHPIDGKIGHKKQFFPDGQLRSSEQFTLSPNSSYPQKNGEYIYYYKPGGLLEHSRYKSNKKSGLCIRYNKNTGKAKSKEHYENGELHGKVVYYKSNGQCEIGQYSHNKKTGNWYRMASASKVYETTYDAAGKLVSEKNYEDSNKVLELQKMANSVK